mmetsp:Transcript_1335/g.2121  ORF Transcript_1335/g.2121 Transcript_1335/m.2121 type:complete len:221 (+) Transcript_1335:368-1030(+)
MDAVGADTNLCAKAVSKAICKACGGVVVNVSRANSLKEALCLNPVLSDDHVGVVRTMGVDVLDGLINVSYYFDSHFEIKKLGAVILFGGFYGAVFGKKGKRLLVSMEFHLGCCKSLTDLCQNGVDAVFVYEKRFRRVTCCGVLGLGVDHKFHCLLLISVFVQVDRADTISMAHHRDLGVVHYASHELVASSRDNQVNVLVKLQQGRYVLARRDELNRVFW